MYIDDMQLTFVPTWEGALDTSGAAFPVRGQEKPQASIGQPTYWALAAPQPPAPVGVQAEGSGSCQRYGLARFPFSLRPGSGHRVRRANFTVSLYPSGSGVRPIAYDAYPATTTTTQEGEVTASLGPDFKFAGAEASLAKVEGKIKLKRPAAAITVYGLGESDVSWAFQERGDHLLDGSLVVYVVIALPPGITTVRTVARLSANINTPMGQLLGRLPEEAEAKVSWVLPSA